MEWFWVLKLLFITLIIQFIKLDAHNNKLIAIYPIFLESLTSKHHFKLAILRRKSHERRPKNNFIIKPSIRANFRCWISRFYVLITK